MMRKRGAWARWIVLACVVATICLVSGNSARAADDSQYFPETGLTVSGKFLQYWRDNGGLPVYGFPITAAQNEVDPETGKTFLTQWFERRRFELHPENAGTQFEVLGGLIGKDLRREAIAVDPNFQREPVLVDFSRPTDQQQYFPETGHNLRFGFRDYWYKNGGLSRFGFPISSEHPEVDPETGKTFLTQWFERARFEYHPENNPPYNILLGLLGNQIKKPKSAIEFAWQVGHDARLLQSAAGIATDPANGVYVVDTQGQRLIRYDSSGNLREQWGGIGTTVGNFTAPYGVAVDKNFNVYIADTGNNRIQKINQSVRGLSAFGTLGNGNGEFNMPFGVATDGVGNIYVADTGNHRIQKFDGNGRFISTFGTRGFNNGQFSSPQGVAVAPDGRLYIADTGNSRIQRFDANGNFQASIDAPDGSADFAEPRNVSVALDGRVLVADTGNNRVVVMNSDGGLLSSYPVDSPKGVSVGANGAVYATTNGVAKLNTSPYVTFGGAYGSLKQPAGIAATGNDSLYVADNATAQIVKYNGAGKQIVSWGSRGTGDGQFTKMSGLATDTSGTIYALDSSYFGARVLRYGPNGEYLGLWNILSCNAGGITVPTGIAVDAQNNVYIADSAGHCVEKFSTSGAFITKWGSAGSGAGQFFDTGGVAVDGSGTVYVADASNARIQKFSATGSFITAFGGGGSGNGQFSKPSGVATDVAGNVYVSDLTGQRVQKFDSNGNFVVGIGSQGGGDGQFDAPTGLAVTAQGIFVADSNNSRIQKFIQR